MAGSLRRRSRSCATGPLSRSDPGGFATTIRVRGF
jgi:hypothetical protein